MHVLSDYNNVNIFNDWFFHRSSNTDIKSHFKLKSENLYFSLRSEEMQFQRLITKINVSTPEF